MSRPIVIDDYDPSISYIGQWSEVKGTEGGVVDLDNAVFNTGHLLTSNGSISLSFTGTEIDVFGVASKLSLPAGDFSQDPDWSCTVDGITITRNKTALRGFPWTSYCSQSGLTDRSHVLNVNITASPQKQFWLDYIRFVPSPGTPVGNQTTLVNSTDPALLYASPPAGGWNTVGTAQFTDVEPGNGTVSVSFTFNGTGITWYGLSLHALDQTDNTIQGGFPAENGAALINLDGTAQMVTIPAANSSNATFDEILFSYVSLDPTKEHVLTATYQKDDGQRTPPLTLDFLLVEGGSSGNTSSGGTASLPGTQPPPDATNSPPDNGGRVAVKRPDSSHKGVIVGAVVGPVAFLLLAALFLHFRRRRQRAARRAMSHPAKSIAFVRDSPEPFDDPEYARHEDDTFSMRTAGVGTHGGARAALASGGGSAKLFEDAEILAPSRKQTAAPPQVAQQDLYSSTSTREHSVLLDYFEPLPTAAPASQSPSVHTVTNPFRRMNLAGSSSSSSFSTPARSPSPGNPFRNHT